MYTSGSGSTMTLISHDLIKTKNKMMPLFHIHIRLFPFMLYIVIGGSVAQFSYRLMLHAFGSVERSSNRFMLHA